MELRYHHLSSIFGLEDAYRWWTQQEGNQQFAQISYESLWQHKGIIDTFTQAYANYMGDLSEEGAKGHLRGDPRFYLVKMKEWHDYVGRNGEYKEMYKIAFQEFISQFLSLSPEENVTLSYEPDGICHACQRKAEGHDVGQHCIDDYRGMHDFAWDQALINYIPPLRYKDHIVRVQGENSPATIVTAEFLRDVKIVRSLDKSFGDYYEHMFDEIYYFKRIGAVEDDSGLINAKVSERYMRGEIML